MSKRKRRQQRAPGFGKSRERRRSGEDLQRTFDRAEDLITQGRVQEIIQLLEPILATYPREAQLHYYLGYARVMTGEVWLGLKEYEQAIRLSDEPGFWLPLATLYLQLGLDSYALNAFRQVVKYQLDHPEIAQVHETIVDLEQHLQDTARRLNLPVKRVEKGLIELDKGQRALYMGDYRTCMVANRQAIRLLGDWPPPYNNLSLALFFDGQPDQAIATARQVLAKYPQNIQALSNAIRFLAWSNQPAEAQELWQQLQQLTPGNASDRLKMSEAAAILEEDESVYDILKPLDEFEEETPSFLRHVQLFLAVAEANTGRQGAERRLKALQNGDPWIDDLLAAVKAKQPGPGWAERFPYYRSSDMMTRKNMDELVNLVGRQDKMPARKFRGEMERFVGRFPQIVRVAEKLLWEERQVEVGIAMLSTLATPEAYAALRRFGLSQAGNDEDRIQALFKLSQAGEISSDETVRVWQRGEWQEMQLRQYEISEEEAPEYAPEVAEALNKGLKAFQRGDDKRAEQLFKRALTLDPQAKEAYNNLGSIYSQREDYQQAKKMLQKALEIDPSYVFPRCNLALFLLNEKDIKGAKDMMEPLAKSTRFRPQEMAFYSYIQARILIHEEEYDAARKALEAALAIVPGYEPAQRLQEHLEKMDSFLSLRKTFDSFMEEQRERDRAKRARLQTKLTTPEPSLAKVLSLYSKDVLTGMGHVIIPGGGWSGLRKAELMGELVGALKNPANVRQMVHKLKDDERKALQQVVAVGGCMAWSKFDADYGNDLDESAYWNYHEPKTIMGRLRQRGLLAEATVDDEVQMVIPAELRPILDKLLG
ncbi:MAG: tetratricopeptide repeat protein [Anaerolineae bacterium]|nr:tetratricopeptide repeat protein [Anaerolineae bacterium]